MAEYIKVEVSVDTEKIQQKLENLITPEVMLELNNLLAKYCDPYVPFLEGPLSQTIEVTTEGVRYTQPYSHYQYHGVNFRHTLDYHPLASAEWDKAMMRDRREEFEEAVKQVLVRRAKELYG